MQFTFKLELTGLSMEDRAMIDDLMSRYCSARRFAFNRLLEGNTVNQTVHLLQDTTLSLNWRYFEHAAKDAEAIIESQKELLPLYLSDTYDKIESVEKASKKAKKGSQKLQSRLKALEKRKDILKEHIMNGTLPKVIFGGRQLFTERAEGKISRDEWKRERNDQVYSIGQANQKGNANIRLSIDKIGINFPHKIEKRKTGKGTIKVKNERKWFSVKVPDKYISYVESVISSRKAYSVRIVRKDGRYFAHVSFEIGNLQLESIPERVCAVDSNPEGFAVAIVKDDGNIVAHKFFRDDRLVYASEEKRDNLIGAIVKGIIVYAKDNSAGAIVIEDLNMRNNKSFGRKGNRIIHAFVRKKFAENIMERSWKEGIPVFTVNPAYTSKIGDRKYREMYGLSIHESAALCIGRRFYGYGEWLNEPIVVGRPRERVPVHYVWTSLYGYGFPKDPYMEPPGRKGSMGKNLRGNGQAVLTGRPAVWPLIRDEGERKGGECGGSPQATGNGVKPAPQGG